MRELSAVLDMLHSGALDAALRAAVPGKVIGVSTYGPGRPIAIWVQDSTSPTDEAAFNAIVAAHDPISLTSDKLTIAADGSDTTTISVSAPKPGAAPIALVIAGTVVPVTLVNGIGAVTITSADPASIPVCVQNPANRTTDQAVIIAK